LRGKKLTSNLREALQEHCLSANALNYWQKKRQFRSSSVRDINWDAFGAAMQAVSPGMQRWVTKMTSGFCATGITMHRRGERTTTECPRCQLHEDVEHVWKCKQDTDRIWKKSLTVLQEWLRENGTHPEMCKQIITGLTRWRSDDGRESKSHIPWIQEATTKQYRYGWGNFFKGFMAREWRSAQEVQLSRSRSKRSVRRWLSALIRKLWQIAWDLWEHRNGYLHRNKDSLISAEVNGKIVEEFRKGTTMLRQTTRALFAGGLETVLSKPLDIRQQWIRRITLARQKDEEAYQETFTAERTLMSQWLNMAGNSRGRSTGETR
jgi:hypothetical protein